MIKPRPEVDHEPIKINDGYNDVFKWCFILRRNEAYLEELSSVLIAVINTDASSENADIKANSKVTREHGEARAVLLQYHLSLEEDTLRSSTVYLSWLADHDGVIFQVIEDDQFANAIVLKAAFNDALFEVTIKSEHLYIINKFIYVAENAVGCWHKAIFLI